MSSGGANSTNTRLKFHQVCSLENQEAGVESTVKSCFNEYQNNEI